MKWITALAWAIVAGAASAVDVPIPSSPAFAVSWDKRSFSHELWDVFVSERVDDRGLVDYEAAREDPRLSEYLHRLANTDAAALPDSNHRKAFWINAYNALAIRGVLATLPDTAEADSYRVIDQPIAGLPPNKGFFQGLRFMVGARRFTLDEIEKKILLRQWQGADPAQISRYRVLAPELGDPRVHFALVCCARGCPRLQRFAYRGERIDKQLDDVTRVFLADPDRSRFDAMKRVWYVSELLRWYGADFSAQGYAPVAVDLYGFAARYVSDVNLRASLQTESWRTKYMKYDWRLNIRP